MTDTSAATCIYHFARPDEWQAAQGGASYQPREFAAEGYIHCATEAQIAGVVERHLRGHGPRLRLSLDPLAFGEQLQYEWSNASNDLYPHLFCPIPLTAVLAVEPFDPGA